MAKTPWIEIRSLRFPDDRGVLTERMRHEMAQAQADSGWTRPLQSLARPEDRSLVLGAGCGVAAALLAGRVGQRYVHVVEPDPARRAYLEKVIHANGLFRMTISEAVPAPFSPRLLVADLCETNGRVPDNVFSQGLRGAVIRLQDDVTSISVIFAQLAAVGLHYFPAQSGGDVLCFLRNWN